MEGYAKSRTRAYGRLVWKTGKTCEPGRERFWEATDRLEYVDSRSLALGDGFVELSVWIGGKTCKLPAEV